MQVYLLDPGLIGRIGHHDHFASGLNRSLQGYPATRLGIFAHRSATNELLETLPVSRVFSQSHYEALSRDPHAGPLEDLLLGSRRFARELGAQINSGPANDDLVLIPTAGPREMLGIGLWLAETHRKPRLAMLFHRVEPPELSLTPGSLGGAMYRYALRAITRVLTADRCMIAATNPRLAELLSDVLEQRPRVVPVPMWYSPLIPGPDVPNREPVITFLGHMRLDRGYREIPPLIRAINSRNAPVRCIVHLGAVGPNSDLRQYQALSDSGLATVITGWQPDTSLAELIHQSTIVVLPYQPDSYRANISGVFALAVAGARPCVVPDQTWMAEQLELGRAVGTTFTRQEPDNMAAAVTRALALARDARGRAEQLAASWRREQSGPAFVAELMAWAGIPAAD